MVVLQKKSIINVAEDAAFFISSDLLKERAYTKKPIKTKLSIIVATCSEIVYIISKSSLCTLGMPLKQIAIFSC